MHQKRLKQDHIKDLLILIAFLTILLINSSCPVYIPLPAHDLRSVKGVISNNLIESLKPGETTREDLLLLAGAPDERYEQDRYFIYEWEASEGMIGLVIPGGSGSSQDHIVVHYLCVEFDEDSRIIRYEHIKSGLFKTANEAYNEMINWRHVSSD